MKKLFTLCMVLMLTLTASTQAQAQSFNYGIVAGYNLTKLNYKGSAKENFTSDNKSGWFVGPKITFNTVLGLGFDASLQYSQRKLNITENVYNANGEIISDLSQSETYRTIEIPINLRYNIGLGKMAGVFIYTGPQFGFALQNMDWDNLGSGNNFSRENMNTTWNIGAGIRLLNHLEASIGYNFALGKAGKAIVNDLGGIPTGSDAKELKYKANTFQLQVAYLF